MRMYYPHGIALYPWVSYYGHGYRGPMYDMQHSLGNSDESETNGQTLLSHVMI